jgi:hypothetical protein
MARRLELQELLEDLLGSSNVYFQPPPNVQMAYPCVVYHLDNISSQHAGDRPYVQDDRYQLTIIHEDPDNDIREKVAALPRCLFLRFFTANKLNHYVFILYF